MAHIAGAQQAAHILKGLGKLADGSTNFPYSALPLAKRFFKPGERTRDMGSLGDLSGQVDVSVADLFVGFEQSSGNLLSAFEADVEIHHSTSNLSYTAASITFSRSSTQRLVLQGLSGGAFRFYVRPKDSNLPVHSALFSVPYAIAIYVDRASLIRDLPSSWSASEANAVLDSILHTAQRVASHALRAMNIRLYFPGQPLPAHYGQAINGLPAGPTTMLPTTMPPVSPQQLEIFMYPGKIAPGFRLSNLIVAGQSFGWFDATATPQGLTNGLDLLASPEAASLKLLIAQRLAQSGSAPAANFDAWGCNDQFLPYGLVNIQARVGNSAAIADLVWQPIETVLAEARQWRPVRSLSDRFSELAGRSLGTQIAHGVCRLLNLDTILAEQGNQFTFFTDEVEEPASNAHPDLRETIPQRLTVHTQLIDPFPSHPLQDLLGIAQPEGRLVQALHADLVSQQTAMEGATGKKEIDQRRVWIATASTWTDLCYLHGWYRGLWSKTNQSSTSPYDVLAGFMSNECLDEAVCMAPLPLPYAALEFREGDRDNKDGKPAIYAGESVASGIDTDLIALVQQDLKMIGLHWGISATGLYGYLRFTPKSQAQWDGVAAKSAAKVLKSQRPNLIAGHTALAIREFQILGDYPTQVFERLDHEPVYAERLYPTEGTDLVAKSRQDLKDDDMVAGSVNGQMTHRTAYLLQRFRFGRRRNPIVMEAWRRPESNQSGAVRWQEDPTRLIKENLVGPHDLKEKAPVTFAIDRSGVFAAPSRRRRRLGKYSAGGWKGPVGAGSRYSILKPTWENTLPGVERPEDKDTNAAVQYLLRIIGGVLQRESGGYLDGYNAWDNAVFSLPPFHPTIARGSGNIPGQMAGFINFFQRPPTQLLEHIFPMPPDGPTIDDTARKKVEKRRRKARQELRHIWYRAYGRFGVGVGWSDDRSRMADSRYSFKAKLSRIIAGADGFVALPPFHTGTATDVKGTQLISMSRPWKTKSAEYKQQQALYQSYSQWFRTWPWVYRFVGAIRADAGVRLATTIYMIEFARRTFQRAANNGISSHFDGSDWTASYLLRAYVRGPDRYRKARGAVKGKTFSSEAARRSAIKAADSKTSFPSKGAPHADFGENFSDKPHPSKTALEKAFLDLNSSILSAFAPAEPEIAPVEAIPIEDIVDRWLLL